ncbi:AraC family transcriptional regulator [Sphingomonas sp. Root710]|uniref:AraC family transcriptional regulator n=1 Tax=Sphingomonas sp. Root710 TaxID=1736594 RepID=UPI00190FCDEC|nr:AraC family transcriptional regulator [Sphingomonas sp. Root710]
MVDLPQDESDDNSIGLDGEAVQALLQGAVLQGHDPAAMLSASAIDPSVYGNPHAAIDGPALVRLVRQIQFSLDDVYLGFFVQSCRLALEAERLLSFLHCGSFGEALRVSIRFTDAMSADVGPGISEEHGSGLRHICKYQTISGVDRNILVWIRFVWIYHFFSWLIGRPLALRQISVRGPKPVQLNGFDRFALFRCPVKFNAPLDALTYDRNDLTARLIHSSIQDYNDYYASEPDWFAAAGHELSWRDRTQQVLIDLQRAGLWSAPIEVVAARLRTKPRRLRNDLSHESESFQDIRTRLRGELAGAYLLASDLPVTSIGFLLGFSEPGSFSRHFISWAGMSPSAYRAAHVNDAAKVAVATSLLNERRLT